MEDKIKVKKEYTDTRICCFMYGLVLLMMLVNGIALEKCFERRKK